MGDPTCPIVLFVSFAFFAPVPTLVSGFEAGHGKITDEHNATDFLAFVNERATQLCISNKINQWNYNTNLTSTTARTKASNSSLTYWKFWKEINDKAVQYDGTGFQNSRNKRLLKILSIYGQFVTNDTQMKKLTEAKQAMEGIFGKAKICSYSERKRCNLTLEPDLTLELQTNRDPDALKHYWLAFREATGRKMRKNYTELATIINDAIISGGHYKSVMAAETRLYETPTLKEDVDSLWKQLEPFYQQLHAYVRYMLRGHYTHLGYPDLISAHGPIPAHLLGNMWAQSWTNIFDLVVPFPDKKSIDVSPKIMELQLTPEQMTRMAEDFFKSLGFAPLPQAFWEGSILEKPSDREIMCHASAWDMCDGINFRIKQCTRPTFEDFLTLHHEMGHIYYQIMYRSEPLLFRDGANPGFHEAIGDLISLSVQTPQHLKTVGLLDEIDDVSDEQADINYLLSMALESFAFLPFGYLVDQWRWGVFQKDITPNDYNCAWWKLRVNVQGVSPPETRTEDDFDPGAKFHVASNTGYIRYFVSSIIQFQFHEALCTAARKYDANDNNSPPLHKCDIHGSREAGHKLMSMLRVGYSRPWQDSMEIMTGKREMDARSILEYFKPLIRWLEAENRRLNVTIGWREEKPSCLSYHSEKGPHKKMKSGCRSSAIQSVLLTVVLFYFIFL